LGQGKPLFRSEDMGGGFRLHLHRTKAFKTVAARLAFHADLDERAAARALVPRVLGRGTRRLPTLRDLQVELDRLYGASLTGDARKIGERHLVLVRADWVMDRLADAPLRDRMADLLAEFLHEPATEDGGGLRNGVIEQERKMMADEAAAVFDDKSRYARHRLIEVMCRTEPFARPAIGREAEIRALEPDAVRQAWAELLERAPAELFLVGDLTWAQAEKFARRLRLHRRARVARLTATRRGRAGRVRTVREHEKVGQAKLAMGFRTTAPAGGPQYPALVFMNALFGGTAVGKLFKQVRERASLCYHIHSFVERTKGLVIVQAGIDAAHYAKARKLILEQLAALQAGRVSPEEMHLAGGILQSSLRAMTDSASALIDFAMERSVSGHPADLAALLAGLASVTVKDVARAARTVKLDTVYLLRD